MPTCKKCWKTYYDPYIATAYCSKQCENGDDKNNKDVEDLFDKLFKNANNNDLMK